MSDITALYDWKKQHSDLQNVTRVCMTEAGKTNSELPTFTNFSSGHSYKNMFIYSVRADFSCLYSYSVVAQGKLKRFYYSLCDLQGFFPGDEIVAPICYTDFIVVIVKLNICV